MPRSTSQASNGPATAPIAFWWKASCSPSSSSASDQRAADDVGVPAHVLRGRVHDDVRAERERLLQVGRGERVVDDQQRAAPRGRAAATAAMSAMPSSGLVGVSTQTTFVLPGRIAARNGVDVVPVGRREARGPSGSCDLGEQPVGAAVRVVGDDDVVAGLAAACAAGCPRRPARRRRPARGGRPRARRGTPPARCGSGWRCGCTRSRRAARRRRPACRSRSGRSAGRPRRSSGPAPGRRGSRGSRSAWPQRRPSVAAATDRIGRVLEPTPRAHAAPGGCCAVRRGDLEHLRHVAREDVVRYSTGARWARTSCATTWPRRSGAAALGDQGTASTCSACARDRRGDRRGVLFWVSKEHRTAEVGFVVKAECQGRGYATEMGAEMLRLAFDVCDLHRVTGRAMHATRRRPP